MIARAIIVLLVLTAIGVWLSLRLIGTGRIGTGKGRHKDTGDGDTEWISEIAASLRPLPAVIPRAPTEHEPPWMAAPVIEPAAVISGPPEPEPEAIIIATRTTSVHVAVLPPLPLPAGELPDWVVEALNGHASTEDALDSIVRRVMLTDGAS